MAKFKRSKKSPWAVIILIALILLSAMLLPASLNRFLPSSARKAVVSIQQFGFIRDLRAKIYNASQSLPSADLKDLPDYKGYSAIAINNDTPFFKEEDKFNIAFKKFSGLDALGRCGAAYACITKDSLPKEQRGEIGMIKPSGWRQAKYPEVIKESPAFLYNRCHLIAYCLSGENANEKNLITGTRHFNTKGMLPLEEQTVKFIERYNVPVLYRVTPIYSGSDLVAKGVLMEALSQDGKLKFCRFVYNVQPGIKIDYATGESEVLK